MPFVVMPDYSKPQPVGITFSVKMNGDGTFGLTSEVTGNKPKLYNYLSEKVKPLPADIHADGKFKFGEVIQGDGYSFVIVPRNNTDASSASREGEWFFSFNTYRDLIESWSEAMKLESVDEKASMVTLTVEDDCPEKAGLFLNKHLEMYLQRTLDKKNQVATNTIEFIDRQLS
ncbi:MAG: hypothetical protein QUS66_01380, partial [Bacteroidota bacterium]|nr:hypothetical protein [Bacteroidota bacterium]